jgi:uncharacterized protein
VGRVVVTGATGLVGRRLVTALDGAGVGVRALSRHPSRAGLPAGVELAGWDGRRPPADALRGAGAVVHLSGEAVFRASMGNAARQRVYASRVDATRSLVDVMGSLPEDERPAAFVCASAVGYYGARGEEILEESAPPGEGFLADLCVAWEAEAARAAEVGARPVSLRFGVVLAREGGALQLLAKVFRLGIGGRVGDGSQWFSWIDVDDAVGLIRRALDDVRARGPLNAVAPHPVRNRDFTRALARALHRPAAIPVPAFLVRTALRELSQELLGSRRVVPRAALSLGHTFTHDEIESALAAELGE